MTDSVAGFQLNLESIIHASDGWVPFRDGVEIYRLKGDGKMGSSSALLRYGPGARVPSHVHGGHEHILVLSGSQRDERGHYVTGTLVINSPGSRHEVTSDEGCVVLVIWEAPVIFETGAPEPDESPRTLSSSTHRDS